jgi:hypothetical protein
VDGGGRTPGKHQVVKPQSRTSASPAAFVAAIKSDARLINVGQPLGLTFVKLDLTFMFRIVFFFSNSFKYEKFL